MARSRTDEEAAPVTLSPAEEAPAVTGSDAAFAEFYRTSWDQVARGLAATVGDPALAGEATDEAMARAYERWGTVAGYEFPAGWVYRVGLNWARSHHRRISRARPLRREEPTTLGHVAEPSVRAALLELPVKYRSVVVCRLLLDWSVDETATALNIAPGTVKSRLSRALTVLESTLGHMR
jgi:RNA polymerase sigma-70 factor (ECF subfamily)